MRPCSPVHRWLLRLSVSILLACVCGIVIGGIVALRTSHNPLPETEGCINAAIGNSFAGPIAGLITLPTATPLFFALLTVRAWRRVSHVQRMAATPLSPPGGTEGSAASHTVGRTVAVASLFGLLTTTLVLFLPSPLNPIGLLNHFPGIQWFLILLTTNSYFPHNALPALLLLIGLFTTVFSLLAMPFVFAGVLLHDRRRTAMAQKAAVKLRTSKGAGF